MKASLRFDQTERRATPNDKDKLPGRLQQLHFSKSRDAGPVNFIGWFGASRPGHGFLRLRVNRTCPLAVNSVGRLGPKQTFNVSLSNS